VLNRHGNQIKPRKTFEEFTSNPEFVKALKRLYDNPDQVDLTVGQYLDETYFPGTTVPSSQLVTSLISLFGLGNSDRFSPLYSLLHCFLVDKPWDCTPTNALDELFWKPAPWLGENGRWIDIFWVNELGLADSKSALWRLIHDNSNVPCVQRDPFFPPDPVKNPIICELVPPPIPVVLLLVPIFVVVFALAGLGGLCGLCTFYLWRKRRDVNRY